MIYLVITDSGVESAGDVESLAAITGMAMEDLVDQEYLENLASQGVTRPFSVPDEKIRVPHNVKAVSEETWEQHGGIARLVDGEIVLGEPEEHVRERQEQAIRFERDVRLRKCDKMSPMRWLVLTDEQKQQWADYRQTLLDIPQQPGFPWEGDVAAVPWPELPE